MFDRIKLKFKMYKPEIETGVGLGLTICGAVEACIQSVKANRTIIVAERELDDISAREDGIYGKKLKRKVYKAAGKELVKTYAVPTVIFGSGLGLMLKSNSDYKNQAANLSMAYTAVSEAYRQYRKRVIDKYGEQVDNDIRFDVHHKKVTEQVTDKEGNTKKEKKDVKTSGNPFLMNPYTYFFDYASSYEFDPNDDFWNENFLLTQQNYWRDVIKTRAKTNSGKPGWVFLNEVLASLGMDANMVGGGQEVGWLYYPDGNNPNGDNNIDFGLLNMYRDPNGDLCFVNDNAIKGFESVWLLDFNCQGNILDILKQY